MTRTREMPDRFVTCPAELRFVVKNLLEEGDEPMLDTEGRPVTYTWRQMIMTAVMADPRLMIEGPLQLDHAERFELTSLARGAPREVFRVGGRALECLQKVILTSPAFDVQMNGLVMHGYVAQQPEVQAWITILLDAPTSARAATDAALGVSHDP